MDSNDIMAKIQSMIAPPSDSIPKSVKKKVTSFHNRKERNGINKDVCESCEEAGDLICCDLCPASFHLECCEPPLSSRNIPSGKWLCNNCRKEAPSASEDHNDEVVDPIRRSLNILIEAIAQENPSQFELPYKLIPSDQFPGFNPIGDNDEKTQPENIITKQNSNNDLLPSKYCYHCHKSCNVSPLIECSYCSLLYHMDCLNPPLAALPLGHWMCPNHVQNFLDERLVNPNSIVERIRVWDEYTGNPVDQDTVKVEFIKKVKNSVTCSRTPITEKKYPKIPDVIKSIYKEHPIELLPSLRDVIRFESLFPSNDITSLSDTTLVDMDVEDNTVTTVKINEEDCDSNILAYVRPLKYTNAYFTITKSYKCLKVGTSAGNDILLTDYGYCNYLSPKHAVIFYDEDSKNFELLNYALYGTEVNNITLAMNTAVHRKSNSDGSNELQMVDTKFKKCPCDWTKKTQLGFEGSATLSHGTLLKFGCIKFVFSIRDLIE